MQQTTFKSNSELLAKPQVIAAVMRCRNTAYAAQDFDDCHLAVEQNPTLTKKLERVAAKRELLDRLKDNDVVVDT